MPGWGLWEDARTPGPPSLGPSAALAALAREPSLWPLRHSEGSPFLGLRHFPTLAFPSPAYTGLGSPQCGLIASRDRRGA